jgi:hypothetical protein
MPRFLMKQLFNREEQVVLDHILRRLHRFRCITLNQNGILDCLDDLERLYQSVYNDHNGEYSDADLLRQRRHFINSYKETHKL